MLDAPDVASIMTADPFPPCFGCTGSENPPTDHPLAKDEISDWCFYD